LRVVLQRVLEASVRVDGVLVGDVGRGLLVLVGAEEGDTLEDVRWLAGKVARMRIFEDEEGKMNRSVEESGGEVLVVSQFTLLASTKKGNRPSFIRAARPEVAEELYVDFGKEVEGLLGREVAYGKFGADMKVQLVNDGPVTITMDSRNRE